MTKKSKQRCLKGMKKHRAFKDIPGKGSTPCKMGRSFKRQFQRAVWDVYSYFEEEKKNGRPLHSVRYSRKRTMRALKVSEVSVYKYIKAAQSNAVLTTPGKKRPRKSCRRDVDSFTLSTIRNIYEFCRTRRHLTLDILLADIKARDVDFYGCRETLRKVVYTLGFEPRKKDGTRFLVEQPHIVLKRLEFLRTFYENHTSPQKKYIIYQDKTLTFQRGTGKVKTWQDSDVRSCPVRSGATGARFIISPAGGRKGFVQGAGLLLKSSLKPKEGDDYHGDMNGQMFLKWFQERLLGNLTEPTIIVMDNASYHIVQASE